MADEEKIQKQMEFIIEQQAQFASDIQQLREVQANTEHLLGRLAVATTAGFKEMGEKITILIDAQIKTEENVSGIAEKVSSLSESVSVLTEKMDELAESQAHTDQRLNAIIDIIREGRNGQTQN